MTSIFGFFKFYYIKFIKILKYIDNHILSAIILTFIAGMFLNFKLLLFFIFIFVTKFRTKKFVYTISLLLGFFYITSFNNSILNEYTNISSVRNFEGVIVEPIVERSFNKEAIININNVKGNALLNIKSDYKLDFTNKINFVAQLKLVKDNERFAPEYKSFLISKNIHYFAQNVEIEKVENNSNLFIHLLMRSRNKLIDIAHSYLSENKSNTINGIIFGAKSNLDEDIKSNLQQSGLSHVVSASGYNIMILYSYLQTLRGRTSAKLLRLFCFLSITFSVLIIGIYILPIQRAFVMIALLILAEQLGRKSNPLNSITISTLFILLQYPLYLKNISLQLSLAATFALFFINPILSKQFKIKSQNKIINYVFDTLIITFSVILTTAPVIVLNFDAINLTGLISNIFILPLIPIFTFLTLIAILFSLLYLGLPSYLSFYFIDYLLNIFNTLVNSFSKISINIQGKFHSILFMNIVLVILLINNYVKSSKRIDQTINVKSNE